MKGGDEKKMKRFGKESVKKERNRKKRRQSGREGMRRNGKRMKRTRKYEGEMCHRTLRMIKCI